MSRPVILRPDAEADVRGIHAGLETVRPGLGDRFAAQLRAVLERIESMPELFAPVWQDVRAVRVRKFRYVVYYVVVDDTVEVLAVLHGARDPAEWQGRT